MVQTDILTARQILDKKDGRPPPYQLSKWPLVELPITILLEKYGWETRDILPHLEGSTRTTENIKFEIEYHKLIRRLAFWLVSADRTDDVDWVWNGGIFHFEHSPNLTDIKYLSAEEAFERYRELPVPTTYEEFYQEELARAVEALRDWQ